MNALFLKLLNMSAAGSVLILAVALLHLPLKRAPRWILCAMWVLAAVRLVCPVSIASPVSAFRATPSIVSEQGEVEVFRPSGGSEKPMLSVDIVQIERPRTSVETIQKIPGTELAITQRSHNVYLPPLLQAYILGLVTMLTYAFSSTLLIKRRVAASVPLPGNIRLCDTLDSPFILGFIRPVIYMPSFLSEQEREFVLAHERAHLRRRDHWWKPLGFLILSIHWFNPICWMAYILLCRDIELACDEKVVRELGRTERAAYTQTLLNCSAHHNLAVCPVAFGETGVKTRVKAALNYKKPAFWIVLAAALGCVVLAGCFATNPTARQQVEPTSAPTADLTMAELSAAPVVDYDALDYRTEKVVFQDRYNEYAEYALSRNMETTTVGNRAYFFEKSINEADRAARIRETEELLQRLGIDPVLRICLYTTLKEPYIEDATVYGRFGSLTGADYTAAVLLGVYGEFCNYGMATGYARLLAGETPEAPGALPADWAYYDLNYLCFQPKFSGGEDAALCEKLALAFAADYVEKHGDAAYLELLQKSGQPETAEAARAALLDFYAAHGAQPVLSPILYAMGGANYDYLANCEYASFYVSKDWVYRFGVQYLNYRESYLHQNYLEVRGCFETQRRQMGQMQEYLALYPYDNHLRIIMANEESRSYGWNGMILSGLHLDSAIYYYTISKEIGQRWDTVHEATLNNWRYVGLMLYCKAMFSRDFRETISFENYKLLPDDDSEAFWDDFIAKIEDPSDINQVWLDYCSAWTYYYDAYQLGLKNWEYGMGGASLIDYLIRQFGDRAVVDYLLDKHELSSVTDLTLDELIAAWKEENEARFALLPKYNS